MGKWPGVPPTCSSFASECLGVRGRAVVIFIFRGRKPARRVKGNLLKVMLLVKKQDPNQTLITQNPETFPHAARKRPLEVFASLFRIWFHTGARFHVLPTNPPSPSKKPGLL